MTTPRFQSGISSSGKSILIDRAVPGVREINPRYASASRFVSRRTMNHHDLHTVFSEVRF